MTAHAVRLLLITGMSPNRRDEWDPLGFRNDSAPHLLFSLSAYWLFGGRGRAHDRLLAPFGIRCTRTSHEIVRVVASLMPRELEATTTVAERMSDAEVDAIIARGGIDPAVPDPAAPD